MSETKKIDGKKRFIDHTWYRGPRLEVDGAMNVWRFLRVDLADVPSQEFANGIERVFALKIRTKNGCNNIKNAN